MSAIAPSKPSNPSIAESWIKIGVVGKAHGLNGAFFVSGRDEPIPTSYKSIRIGSPESETLRVAKTRQQSGRSIMRIKGIDDRNGAEAITGQDIYVSRQAIKVDEDEFLWSDLEGRRLVDDQGQEVGTIQVIHNQGASDIARVVSPVQGVLEIPLVDQYFDLEFEPEGDVSLVVGLETFEGLWAKK